MVEPVGEPDPSWHTYKAVQARRRQYLSDKWVEKKFMHSWAGEAAAAGGRAPPPTAAAAAALPALLGATSFAARGLLLCARQQHWRPDSAAWG